MDSGCPPRTLSLLCEAKRHHRRADDHRRTGRHIANLGHREKMGRDRHPSVTLYTVTDGGHTIPNPTKKALFILGRTNRNISAAEKIWHTMTSAANS